MAHHLDAFDNPPEVRAVGGEILITGDHVSAAYTVEAARALILLLQHAVLDAEKAPPAVAIGGAPHLRAVS